jgi:cytochrome P450
MTRSSIRIDAKEASVTFTGGNRMSERAEAEHAPRNAAAAVADARAPLRCLQELPGPRGLPLVGNLLQLEGSRLHRILQAWAQQYGALYRLRAVGRDILAVADGELIGEVLRSRPEVFARRRALRKAMLELGIDGVFNAEGPDWRRQRKLAMYALNTAHMREFFGRLERVTARLQRRWEAAARDGETVDTQRDLMRFTVDVTSGLAFGKDLNTLEQTGDAIQNHLDKIFPALTRRLLAPFPYWRYVKLPADRALDTAMAEVRKLVNGLIADCRAQMAADPGRRAKPGNFLEAMIAAQDDEAGGFSDAEIVGNALTMLLAGEDTTANTIGWMMHFMVEFPQVQAAMHEEADRVLGEHPRPMGYATTEALPYIEAVAHEAMRLKPVAPFLAMEANRDTAVGGVEVKAGTIVFLVMNHPGQQQENFRDPQAFRPQRWLEADGRAGPGHNPRMFMPFGGGPRYCPGRHLAMLEIKMVAAMLARNFEVARAPGTAPTEERFSSTLAPKNLLVTLRRR